MPAYRAELAHELPIAAARQVHRSVASVTKSPILTVLRQTAEQSLTIRCKERSNSELDGRQHPA